MTVPVVDDTRLTPNSLAGLRIAPVSQRPKTINFLVYGESGIGKTILGGSADAVPQMRPVLIVDVEGGAFSLLDRYPDVEVVRVETWNELQELYYALHAGDHPYKTVVLDSLTEIQKFSMNQIMVEVVAKEPGRDPDIPSLREWGKNIEQIRRLVRAFRDLPVNTIFTALLREEKDNKTGTVTLKPMLSGKLASEVAAFLDIVTYLYVVSQQKGDEMHRERVLLTGATEKVTAKDRSNRLPLTILNPTMQEIYDYAVAGKVADS